MKHTRREQWPLETSFPAPQPGAAGVHHARRLGVGVVLFVGGHAGSLRGTGRMEMRAEPQGGVAVGGVFRVFWLFFCAVMWRVCVCVYRIKPALERPLADSQVCVCGIGVCVCVCDTSGIGTLGNSRTASRRTRSGHDPGQTRRTPADRKERHCLSHEGSGNTWQKAVSLPRRQRKHMAKGSVLTPKMISVSRLAADVRFVTAAFERAVKGQ